MSYTGKYYKVQFACPPLGNNKKKLDRKFLFKDKKNPNSVHFWILIQLIEALWSNLFLMEKW